MIEIMVEEMVKGKTEYRNHPRLWAKILEKIKEGKAIMKNLGGSNASEQRTKKSKSGWIAIASSLTPTTFTNAGQDQVLQEAPYILRGTHRIAEDSTH